MNWIKANINGILGTIIFHLLIIIIAMISELRTHYNHVESYTYIDMDFLEQFEDKALAERSKELQDFNLEQMISEIRNLGSNRKPGTTENIENMSLDELRRKYEEQILREKYGDDYEKNMNTTYKDFIDSGNDNSNKSNIDNTQTESYSGPALVFVELENELRGHVYVDIPVFTCKDGGVVVVDIIVSSDGKVSRTSVNSVTGHGETSCIINAARTSASKSRFSPISGATNESGKITYHFMKQ